MTIAHPPSATILRLLAVCVVLVIAFCAEVSADDHVDEAVTPLRFETLAHGKTELMSYLVSQPVHDGSYGRNGMCDLVVTMRNVGAKHVGDLDKMLVVAFDQGNKPIKTILVNKPQSIPYGDLTAWQIRLFPANDWPQSVTLKFRSHDDAFVDFEIATPEFVLLRSPK